MIYSFKKKVVSVWSNKKNWYLDVVFSIFYFFRQLTNIFFDGKIVVSANLDPFYLGAPIYIYKNRKNIQKLKILSILCLCLIGYGIIQIILIPDINIMRSCINIAKIFFCIVLIFYMKENYYKVNFLNIIKIISVFYLIFTLVSFVFKNGILWTHMDVVNKYNLSRLRLFYLEPSELGFHLMVIIIFLVGFLVKCNTKRNFIELLCLIFINFTCLFLAKPFGAICCGALAIVVMIIYDWINNCSKRKNIIYICLGAVILTVLTYMIIVKDPIYMRICDTLNGTDKSNHYRVKVAIDVSKNSFFDTYGIGVGFGNMTTDRVVNNYVNLGYERTVVSSFLAVITEGGIFAIVFLICLIAILAKNCMHNRSAIKWGLFVFLMTYQIFGGHFTNGLCWILYGLILSDFDISKKFKNNKIC